MRYWARQSHIPTANTGTLRSTLWLAPFQRLIRATVASRHAADPHRTDYTPAVFAVLPRAALVSAYTAHLSQQGRAPDTSDPRVRAALERAVRTHLGMRVPIEMVWMFGGDRVDTRRKDTGDRRKAAPLPTGRAWPAHATPHRVRP